MKALPVIKLYVTDRQTDEWDLMSPHFSKSGVQLQLSKGQIYVNPPSVAFTFFTIDRTINRGYWQHIWSIDHQCMSIGNRVMMWKWCKGQHQIWPWPLTSWSKKIKRSPPCAMWAKKGICVFTVSRSTLIFCSDPKLFMALLVENYLNTLFLPSNVVLDV